MDRQDDIPEDDDLGDGEGGGFRGNDDDSQAPDQSIPQVPPNPPQQPHKPMPQPLPRTSGLDGALPPISTHLSKLANVLASRTADGYLNDFQQTWGSRLPGLELELPASDRMVMCSAKSESAKPMASVAAQLRCTRLHALKIFQSEPPIGS